MPRIPLLKRCTLCSREVETLDNNCDVCSASLIVVLYSVVNGVRITETRDEEVERQTREMLDPSLDRFAEFKPREPMLFPSLMAVLDATDIVIQKDPWNIPITEDDIPF